MAIQTFVNGNPATGSAPTPGTVVNADYLNQLERVRDANENVVNALRYNSGVFNATTLNAAITDIGAAKVRLFIKQGNWSINANVVFPANIIPVIEPGSVFVRTESFTVTMPRRFSLSGGLHFSGSSGFIVFAAGAPPLKPEWWGAVGDDIVDDYAAFAAAEAALPASGGALEIDALDYYLSAGLSFGKSTKIFGQGRQYSTLRFSTSVTTAMLFNNNNLPAPGPLNDCEIWDVKIEGNTNITPGCIGVHFYGCDNPKIIRSYVQGFKGTATSLATRGRNVQQSARGIAEDGVAGFFLKIIDSKVRYGGVGLYNKESADATVQTTYHMIENSEFTNNDAHGICGDNVIGFQMHGGQASFNNPDPLYPSLGHMDPYLGDDINLKGVGILISCVNLEAIGAIVLRDPPSPSLEDITFIGIPYDRIAGALSSYRYNFLGQSSARFGSILVDGVSGLFKIKEDGNRGATTYKTRPSAFDVTYGANTGDGTIGSIVGAPNLKEGLYTLVCTAAAANAGTFSVQDPDGNIIGPATVGVAYTSPQIGFTISDGAVDWIVGDTISIFVPCFEIIATLNGGGTLNATGSGKTISFQTGGTEFGNLSAAGLESVQPTLGSQVHSIRSIVGAASDVQEMVYQDRLVLTDATLTTLHSFEIGTDMVRLIEGRVVARRTGGAAGAAGDGAAYEFKGLFSNNAGTVAAIGASAISVIGESQAAWGVQLNISGTAVLLQVQGAVDNNVTWQMAVSRTYELGD